jgi:hypothetical protein
VNPGLGGVSRFDVLCLDLFTALGLNERREPTQHVEKTVLKVTDITGAEPRVRRKRSLCLFR